MRAVTIAITQFACGSDAAANLDRAEGLVRGAAAAGANIVVLQELFETVYFCREPDEDHFRLARPAAGHPVVARFAALAKELDIVVPVPFFEKGEDGDCFNSVAVIDAGGRELGIYRKTHIPNGDGYREKFYFRAGTEAPRAWDTKFGRLGVAICWDQWFPEVARLMMLAGAELLIYPSAIGSEPADPGYDSKPAWRHAMQGHAAANVASEPKARARARSPSTAARSCAIRKGRSPQTRVWAKAIPWRRSISTRSRASAKTSTCFAVAAPPPTDC